MGWKPKYVDKGKAEGKPAKVSARSAKEIKPRTFGSRQLARETGYSQAYCSNLLLKGISHGEIKRRAAERKAGIGPGPGRKVGSVNKSKDGSNGPVVDSAAPTHDHRAHFSSGRIPTKVRGEDLRSAQTRKEIALADQREMEIAVRRGQLVDRVQMELWFADGIVKAKNILLRLSELGDRLAQEQDPAACRETLDKEVYRALAELQAAWQLSVDSAEAPVEVEVENDGQDDED